MIPNDITEKGKSTHFKVDPEACGRPGDQAVPSQQEEQEGHPVRDHHAGGLRLPRHVHDPHPARSRGGASVGDESLDLPNQGLFSNILISS